MEQQPSISAVLLQVLVVHLDGLVDPHEVLGRRSVREVLGMAHDVSNQQQPRLHFGQLPVVFRFLILLQSQLVRMQIDEMISLAVLVCVIPTYGYISISLLQFVKFPALFCFLFYFG